MRGIVSGGNDYKSSLWMSVMSGMDAIIVSRSFGLVFLLPFFVVVESSFFGLGCVTDADCNVTSCANDPYYQISSVKCMLDTGHYGYNDIMCFQYIDPYGYFTCYLYSCNVGLYRLQVSDYVEKCERCPTGKVMPDINNRALACYTCDAGKYQDLTGMSECTNCPVGKYGTSIGKSSVAQACIDCAPGYWQANEGSTRPCVVCAAGKYQALNGSSSCNNCPAGSYGNVTGASSVARGCILCSPGYWQVNEGVTTGCVICAAGKYQALNGSSSCNDCPAGSYGNVVGASSMASGCVVCTKGSAQAVAGAVSVCTVCVAGKYQDLDGQARCKDCPVGTFGVTVGATSFLSGCSVCAPGTYASFEGASQCLSCSGALSVPVGYYHARRCNSGSSPLSELCPVCKSGDKSRPCTETTPTQCGAVKCTAGLLGLQPDYTGDWLTEEYKCGPGEYLRGFNTSEDKDCRRCPADMVGRDGVKCEWCQGPLEEPYALDRASCVCTFGAVMNSSGGCECEDGRRFNATSRGCEPCPLDMYGVGGQCYACGAGTFSGILGATVCEGCAVGKYRLQGQSGGCRSCVKGPGHYAPVPWNDTCVACNRSCGDGWSYGGPCPDGSVGFGVCLPCRMDLPGNATWIQGGGCVYKCNAGYYFSEWDMGMCKPCSVGPCPAGLRGRACSEYEDRTCDTECSNASKPVFYSKWSVSGTDGGCPWECEAGYVARETDYLLFRIHECVPQPMDSTKDSME